MLSFRDISSELSLTQYIIDINIIFYYDNRDIILAFYSKAFAFNFKKFKLTHFLRKKTYI